MVTPSAGQPASVSFWLRPGEEKRQEIELTFPKDIPPGYFPLPFVVVLDGRPDPSDLFLMLHVK